jgi:hypothetical protein
MQNGKNEKGDLPNRLDLPSMTGPGGSVGEEKSNIKTHFRKSWSLTRNHRTHDPHTNRAPHVDSSPDCATTPTQLADQPAHLRWPEAQPEMTEADKEQFKNSSAQALLEQFGDVTDSNG